MNYKLYSFKLATDSHDCIYTNIGKKDRKQDKNMVKWLCILHEIGSIDKTNTDHWIPLIVYIMTSHNR